MFHMVFSMVKAPPVTAAADLDWDDEALTAALAAAEATEATEATVEDGGGRGARGHGKSTENPWEK